jgi:hypothetical protein
MAHDLRKVFDSFLTTDQFISGAPYGSGHIHDTFKIITAGTGTNDYILQRINDRIFTNVPGLQKNIELVTTHLRRKLAEIPGSDPERECLTLIPTRNGKAWYTDEEGKHWRLYIFIRNHNTYDIVDSDDKAYEGGKAIGRFLGMLADLPGELLSETIPFFHNIEKRLIRLEAAVKADVAGRVDSAAPEIEKILSRAEEMKVILRLGAEGKIPLRVTHNDTKFNNVLLDENDKALCVIDLDTVMPGYVHYDFGDAIRTAANSAAEDEADLSLVKINTSFFEAWTKGFLEETREILTPTEKQWLAFAPRLITYTIATRFLTDYLEKDVYFKIKHPGHNLQRAKAQIKLVESMEACYGEMEDIVRRYS